MTVGSQRPYYMRTITYDIYTGTDGIAARAEPARRRR